MFKYVCIYKVRDVARMKLGSFLPNRVLDTALVMLFHAYSNVFEKYVVSVMYHILQIMPHKSNALYHEKLPYYTL